MELIFDLFDRRGWRDAGGTALSIARHLEAGGGSSRTDLATLISPTFLARNSLRREAAAKAIADSLIAHRPAASSAIESVRPLLLLSADPTDQTSLRIQSEQRMVREELEKSKRREHVNLQIRPGLLRTDIARYLIELRPAVVHFSGHGGTAGISVEDAAGHSSLISTTALANLFSLAPIAADLSLVVLSSCLSEAQAVAIADSVPCVIGMRGSIRDESALAFSRGLYMALGQGLPASEAYEFGRNAIELEDIPEADLPRLLHRSGVDPGALYPLGI